MQSLLDSLPHHPVDFELANVPIQGTNPPQINTVAVCPAHKQAMCETCGVDFMGLNHLNLYMRMAPDEAIPPPPNVQPAPQRAEIIKNLKEQGNVSHKFAGIPSSADPTLDCIQGAEIHGRYSELLKISGCRLG